MFVAVIPNRGSPPAILLRESYREGQKVKTRTLANLSRWPPEKIQRLRQALRGEQAEAARPLKESFEIVRSLPHGHVAAVLGTARKLGLPRLINRAPSRQQALSLAMIVARVLDPASKLATARGLHEQTLASSLGEQLLVESADEDELYEAMDFLLGEQDHIERALAKRHLVDGSLVLYDVTSAYFEGRHCPLAKHGYSRDGKKDRLQIVFGLLTNVEGCPVAVEVFEGNMADPKTLRSQVTKLRERFGLARVVLVGDRGMITQARIREDLSGMEGLDWITSLRAPAVKQLVEQGWLELSLFDERDLVEITSPDYPGERLVVCRNPLLAAERSRKRGELLEATERELAKIAQAAGRARRPLRGRAQIALRVGKVMGRFKVGKHFLLHIEQNAFHYERNEKTITEEAALDGLYVIRTSLKPQTFTAEQLVLSYKGLSAAERAFRSLKSVDLKVRPIFHRLEDRVKAHIFLCMLAYYVEWHMRHALAPMLFDDEDKESKETLRPSVVAKAQRSLRAQRKAATKRSDDGSPVHSFQTLLKDLATLAKNRVQPTTPGAPAFNSYTKPTPLQEQAFRLLGVPYRPKSV
jgi:transposase